MSFARLGGCGVGLDHLPIKIRIFFFLGFSNFWDEEAMRVRAVAALSHFYFSFEPNFIN